jgi:ABC-type nitrate/sulfonate/bicarbonate transport system permease component
MAADVSSRRHIMAGLILPVLGVAALLAVWELAPRLELVRPTSIPPFSAVFREAGAVVTDPAFLSEVAGSAAQWAMGLGLAVLIGVPLGITMARFRLARVAVEPVLTISYPMPKVVVVLLLVPLFGAGMLSRVIVVVLACLIPIVLSSFHGASTVEPHLIWSARSLGTGRVRVLFRVILPAALPEVLSGLRLAIAVSIFALMAAELMIRQSGVGAYLYTFYDVGATLRVWATASVIALAGFVADAAYVRLVRSALPWLEGEV